MIIPDEMLDDVSNEISALTGIPVEPCTVLKDGFSGRGIRLADFARGKGIQVGLARTMSMSLAEVFPESSAGGLVRFIGRRAQDNPEIWRSAISSTDKNLSIITHINNEFYAPSDDPPDSRWSTLSLELTKTDIAKSKEQIVRSLTEVGSAAISSALACLFECDGDYTQFSSMHEALPEGASVKISVNRYERSPLNRQRCITYHGATCWVCEMDFGSVYGPLGRGYIQVHHLVPISQLGPNYLVDPIHDLIPLCSNCHSAVHFKNPPFSPQELRSLMNLAPKSVSPK
ncbi:HNH endonuclease [Glutamicibacter mishrai]|uniref:HNH endonuclease n=1 Tax=Glutamicibacter mishrai TaxID=1775880 RepID=UPI0020CE4ED7|nr:HNH endonuclease [Glutamicibacter mishrai]UTT39439.1 HNH endonuclease [Glutamicibacter mishrai]